MLDVRSAAAILAGGRARRFGGRDKSRLVVGGRTIIVRQVQILQRVADDVFVVGAPQGQFDDVGLVSHPDHAPGLGVIGGIATALSVTSADRVLVVACDAPFLHEELLQALLAQADDADGAWVRTERGPEPLLACYRQSARPAIEQAIAAGRLAPRDLGDVLRLREISGAQLAAFGPVDRLLANLNTPDEYGRVQ